jgi:hypothetical protein
MEWREVKDFINKQLDDGDEIDILYAVCKGDEMDLTIGFEGALQNKKVQPFDLVVTSHEEMYN